MARGLAPSLAAAFLVAVWLPSLAGAEESVESKGFGIWTRNLSHAERAARSGDGAPGVVVTHVAAGSPADVAGVRAGQRIVAVDGRAVPHDESLGALLRVRSSDGSVRLDLEEGGVGTSVRARPVERLSFLRPACERGDGEACWDIVLFYGWRVAPPPGAAGRAAAEDHACGIGSARACASVGFRLASRPADRARALGILEQSCADGDGDACRMLGNAYARGFWGLAVDRRQAVRF